MVFWFARTSIPATPSVENARTGTRMKSPARTHAQTVLPEIESDLRRTFEPFDDFDGNQSTVRDRAVRPGRVESNRFRPETSRFGSRLQDGRRDRRRRLFPRRTIRNRGGNRIAGWLRFGGIRGVNVVAAGGA